jgi:plastocyanin
LEKDKVVDIQIKTTKNNGTSETVNFVPNEIAVEIGTIVIWTNSHSSIHTVTFVNNNTFGNNDNMTEKDGISLIDSDYMNTGNKFAYNFQPGRFDYFDKNTLIKIMVI